MKSEALRPDSYHAPAVKQNDSYSNGIEHGFGRKSISLLDIPEGKDPNRLCCYAHNQEVSQFKKVVRHNLVLQGSNDSYSRVEGVSKKKVSVQVISSAQPLTLFRSCKSILLRPYTRQD